MNHKQVTTIILALALGALALSCADSESRMPLGDATAVIKLTHTSSPLESIVPGAPLAEKIAISAPAAFDRVMVTITGPDIGTIQRNFPYADTITLDVPSGGMRRFEVTAFVSAYNPDFPMTYSAAATFKGVASVNIPSGMSVSVPVFMIMEDSKFVIPDYRNQRIVQFDSIATAADTWIASNCGITSFFYPRDVDFDARGRIYIMYNDSLYDYIIRVDNLRSVGYQEVLDSAYYSNKIITAMTIDKRRNLLYFAYNNGMLMLQQADLGALPATLTNVKTMKFPDIELEITLCQSITAMDVGADGMLYILGIDGHGAPVLFKFNPLVSKDSVNGELVGTPFNIADLYVQPRDLQLHGGNACVLTDAGGGDMNTWALIQFQFTPDGFVPGAHFGSVAMYDTPPQDAYFYGPTQFAIRRENMLVIVDEVAAFDSGTWRSYNRDRLVLTDFDVSRPWSTYGSSGSGTDQFQFYSYC